MFLQFFTSLRDAQVPVTLREYLTLMEALDADLAEQTVENFYYLSRAALVKDERNLDKFDRVFGTVFKGLESLLDAMGKAEIPEEWLKKLAEKYLTEEEKKQIEAMGWDKLMETLKKRLEEQKGRHQGGSKWIGTAGTSPFGAHGYNPEGVRIGQEKNVTVYKIITRGTMEESIQDILDGKTQLAGAVVGQGEGWITELGTGELAQLISYRGQND